VTGAVVTVVFAVAAGVTTFVRLRRSVFGPVVACAAFGAVIALSGCVGIIHVGIRR
jgi:hypothetical protein